MDSIISDSLPINNSITSSSILTARKASRTSTTVMSRRLVESIDVAISTDSVASVGYVALFLLLLLRCFLPPSHMRPLICPVCLSLRNISALSASDCYSDVSDVFFTGLKASLLWSCWTSVTTPVFPCSLYRRRPDLSMYCVSVWYIRLVNLSSYFCRRL